MTQNGPRMTQKDPKLPKKYPKWPKITPKWPKNDARIYALFPQIFLTGKAVPQTFSLLECMPQCSVGLRECTIRAVVGAQELIVEFTFGCIHLLGCKKCNL